MADVRRAGGAEGAGRVGRLHWGVRWHTETVHSTPTPTPNITPAPTPTCHRPRASPLALQQALPILLLVDVVQGVDVVPACVAVTGGCGAAMAGAAPIAAQAQRVHGHGRTASRSTDREHTSSAHTYAVRARS